MGKLGKEQIVTISVLQDSGQSQSQTARLLGVTEGAVRYHLRRARSGTGDGRGKTSLVGQLGLAEAVKTWWLAQAQVLGPERPPNVEALHAWLIGEYGYPGSYKSGAKHVRAHFPPPRRRPFRRVETPPGAQSQTDWGEFRAVDIGAAEGPSTLYAFVMTLSHSRKEALIWSPSMDQLAWHHCHNEAYKRLGGVAAVNRIDNLKTGIVQGAGAWGKINSQYQAYARALGFHIDACEAHQPQQKGKTERRVGALRLLELAGKCYDGLAHLQQYTDGKLELAAQRRICPATGSSVHAAWQAEKPLLGPLPALLPEPFDLVQQRVVYKDCTVRFEGRTYAVPFRYLARPVEVRGCSGTVQVLDPQSGQVVVQYPRHSAQRILIDPSCYEGPATATVEAPKPLGKMGRRLQQIAALPVQKHPIDLYAALAEVAR